MILMTQLTPKCPSALCEPYDFRLPWKAVLSSRGVLRVWKKVLVWMEELIMLNNGHAWWSLLRWMITLLHQTQSWELRSLSLALLRTWHRMKQIFCSKVQMMCQITWPGCITSLCHIACSCTQTYLQPHYGNGVLGSVYLSAGQN